MKSAIAITCLLLAAGLAGAAAAQSHSGSAGGYLTPPQEIVDILDAPPTPSVLVGPNRDVIVLMESRSMPPIAWQARPLERLAGYRIDPRNSGPWRAPETAALTIRRVDDDASSDDGLRIEAPHGTTIGWPQFSPDGSHLSYAVLRDTGIELWVVNVASGKRRALTSASLNATWRNPCEWLFDSSGVLCRFRVPARGAPPSPPRQPDGPNVQEHDGRLAPVRTYQDLLANAHDEALFEYHFTSRIETVDLASGTRTAIGEPGLYSRVSGAPDSRHVLVERIERPFSWLHPASRFPRSVEVWTRDAGKVATVATLPLADAVPIGGVPTGPRGHRWNPTASATLVWSEAQDGGDPKAEVPHRDYVFTLDAPFDGEPRELTRTEFRFSGIAWTEGGTALVNSYDRETRWIRTALLDVGGDEPRPLFDRSAEDRYGDPGFPWQRPGGGTAGATILQDGDDIYLVGRGASPDGRPALRRPPEPRHAGDGTAVPQRAWNLRDGGRGAVGRQRLAPDPPRERHRAAQLLRDQRLDRRPARPDRLQRPGADPPPGQEAAPDLRAGRRRRPVGDPLPAARPPGGRPPADAALGLSPGVHEP